MPTKTPVSESPDARQALAAMRRMRIGVLSVLLKPGQPYSAVVNVHVDDHFRLYFATDRKTRKYKALLKHPNVAFNMGFQDEMVNNFQIMGKASVVKDAARWQDVLESLELERPADQLVLGLREMTSHYPFRHFPSNDSAVVMIEPAWIRWFRHEASDPMPRHIDIVGHLK